MQPIDTNTVACPQCKRNLIQSFPAQLSFIINPQMHKCRKCEITLYSWVMCISAIEAGKRIIILNAEADKWLLSRLQDFRVFDYHELLIITENELRKYTNDFIDCSYETILKIYEYKLKEPILN